LEVGQTPLSTVEDMASIYLAEVRRIQPTGPYQIGGYSFGALVAYEMAQQLYATGDEVSLLVIIDAGPPRGNKKKLDLSELDILEPKPAHVIRWLKLYDFQVDENEINSMPLPDFAERYMDRHGIKGDLNIYLQLYRAAVASRIAKYRYRPRPYPGRITLFRGNNPGEHDFHWGQFAAGGVDVYRFDVGHQYMLSDQNIPALAAQLSSCLAAVDRAG
jgi:thioesterase domain-containing protein